VNNFAVMLTNEAIEVAGDSSAEQKIKLWLI
jgi:hypothetical protein